MEGNRRHFFGFRRFHSMSFGSQQTAQADGDEAA
jgi:hypothetical protein